MHVEMINPVLYVNTGLLLTCYKEQATVSMKDH